MNLVTPLARAAIDRPTAIALYRGDSPWATYAHLTRQVAALASALRGRLGLEPRDRVALVLGNCPEYLVALYAIWWAGLVAVPINAKLHEKEVAFIVADCGAKHVFAGEGGRAEIIRFSREGECIPYAVPPGELAWLFYTSGTTGRPKGAMLTHANLASMTRAYFASVDSVPIRGRLLHAAPLSHGSGLYNFTHLAMGAAQVVPESGGFDAAEVLALLEAHRDVSLFAAPTMVKRLTDAAREAGLVAPGLRTLVYGGGPMYLNDIRETLDVLGERFAQIYGQGESPMTITALGKAQHADRAHPRWLSRLASVGLPHEGIALAIRDAQGRDLPVGETGEVCVRGATVMAGYWNNPEASAAALREGWLWTGDLGALDEDGYLTLKDRSKDLIISGGSNIYPREIEEVLLLHAGVSEVSVVGRRDAEWGEVPVAFVVARGATPAIADLDRLCLEHIARFKRPKDYRFVDALPKNHYGKVLKTQLRALLEEPG